MNTPGGAVNSAGEIINLIGKMNIPIYTYVDNGAYSAGAFIALATPKIYMSPKCNWRCYTYDDVSDGRCSRYAT